MNKFLYTSPQPTALASGRPVGIGDEVSLSADEIKANQGLIDSGSLIKKPAEAKPKAARKADSTTSRRK